MKFPLLLPANLQEKSGNLKIRDKIVYKNAFIFLGILDKKKGLFNRRRMFLLTEGPHLYYVDSSAMVLKGEIPWSSVLKTEIRDFQIFFVHVPGRIYYLIDRESTSKDWCAAIDEVKQFYFGNDADVAEVSSTTAN